MRLRAGDPARRRRTAAVRGARVGAGLATAKKPFLAMLLVEQLTGLENPPRVQVFATDIDEHAMAVGRSARYPEALLESVSPARRERFFRKEGESFVLSSEVRELCIFSPHSVFRDPPFSRMDLIPAATF